jgi:hypothetical protein
MWHIHLQRIRKEDAFVANIVPMRVNIVHRTR